MVADKKSKDFFKLLSSARRPLGWLSDKQNVRRTKEFLITVQLWTGMERSSLLTIARLSSPFPVIT